LQLWIRVDLFSDWPYRHIAMASVAAVVHEELRVVCDEAAGARQRPLHLGRVSSQRCRRSQRQ
jgi:hypothetical protein